MTAEKCIKNGDARAKFLLCLSYFCFAVLVDVAVLVA